MSWEYFIFHLELIKNSFFFLTSRYPWKWKFINSWQWTSTNKRILQIWKSFFLFLLCFAWSDLSLWKKSLGKWVFWKQSFEILWINYSSIKIYRNFQYDFYKFDYQAIRMISGMTIINLRKKIVHFFSDLSTRFLSSFDIFH